MTNSKGRDYLRTLLVLAFAASLAIATAATVTWLSLRTRRTEAC